MDFRYKELSWKDICLDWDDFVFSLGKGYKMEGEVLTMFLRFGKRSDSIL